MNKLIVAIIGVPLIAVASDDAHDVLWGARNSANAKVCYRVVDPDGNSVADADINVGYRTDYPKVKVKGERLRTDANGECVAEGDLNYRIGVCVDKPGWYKSFDSVEVRKTKANPAIVDGKWQPYGEHRTIVLKPYRNPIVMSGVYERKDVTIPAFGEWLPYDFEKGNWLPPHGDGVHPDVLLRFTYNAKNRYWNFISTMDVSFTNNPCAGFYVRKKCNASEMKCDYQADMKAEYVSSFHFKIDGSSLDGSGCNNIGKDDYVVFRTRTKVDCDGALTSAHYGKIMGEWFFSDMMVFDNGYSFNSTENDTNLEDEETHRRSVKRRKHERELRERGK